MQLELAGKTALVTGGSRGLGRAIARVLHEEGCRLAVNGRDAGTLAAAAGSLSGAVALAGDVTQFDEARRIVAEAAAFLSGGARPAAAPA